VRITKSMVETLTQGQKDFLYSHMLYKQLQKDYQETVYQAVLDLDPAAAGMAVVVHSTPKIVKDQLPKVSQTRINQVSDSLYKQVVDAGFELPPENPFKHYGGEHVDFPAGKVLYSGSADTLRPISADRPTSLSAWTKVIWAKYRVQQANLRIQSAARHLEQLCYEMGTLDKLMEQVPSIRHLIPASWLAEPVAAPKTNMVDPDTAARLRALILGEKA